VPFHEQTGASLTAAPHGKRVDIVDVIEHRGVRDLNSAEFDRDPRKHFPGSVSASLTNNLRLLYVGPFNSPHLEDLAIAMRDRGHVVQAGGQIWGGLPESSLPRHDVPTKSMTFPSVLSMRRLIREFEPDIVHAHWMPFAALAAIAAARPLVATAWGSDVYAAGWRRLLETRVALRRASIAMADSAHLLARLQQLGPSGLRTMLVNWGVDLESFRVPSRDERATLKARLGLGSGPLVFSPRGLEEIYNPSVVVEAFVRVRANLADAQLVLKHNRSDEERRSDWGNVPGVKVVGHVAHDEMAALFRAAEVTVSIAASDSSPRSVWEAMASGSSTVLSDLPWVHELIVDGRDALVVEPRADAVAAGIERLLGNDQLRYRIATSARKLVERHLDRGVQLARVEACYYELVRGT
jgi:glycosyltransferase involved in cell wall biosynthesis